MEKEKKEFLRGLRGFSCTALALLIVGCGGENESNQSPQARAGADQSVDEETTVTLDGASSSDPDGRITTWQWSQVSNGAPTVTINDANSSRATFIAPDVESDTELEFQLRVQDDSEASATDNVVVLVRHVNALPVSVAGDDQAVDEFSEVTLDGSASSDADGRIVSYSWSQVSPSSIEVNIQNQDSATATFQAPEVTEDIVFEFELRVEDNEGGVSVDRIQVSVANVELRITGLSSSFGWYGDSIEVEVAGLHSASHGDVEVLLGGNPIAPRNLETDRVTFVIPDGAVGYGLHILAREQLSNGVPFRIRKDGLVPPRDEDFTTDEDGVRVVTSYLIVQLIEDQSTIETAQQIARSIGGEVIGRFDFMDWWQISIPSQMSIEDLAQLAISIESKSEVADAFLDYADFTSDAIDWSGDPDSGVRELNDVETGALLYEQEVGPAANASVAPFFMSINVMEANECKDCSKCNCNSVGIDFSVDDFATLRPDIYAKSNEDPDTPHATNVLGVIAAELAADASDRGVNRPGNAGVVRALQRSHGGANINLDEVPSFILSLSRSIGPLEDIGNTGVGVVNWSWSNIYVSHDAIDCEGVTPSEPLVKDTSGLHKRYAERYREFFDRLLEDYPNIVVVQAAGNHRMSMGFTPPALVGMAENYIIVGAHTVAEPEHKTASEVCFSEQTDTRVKRADYSNFGNRVDIAAGGAHFASKCKPDDISPSCIDSGTGTSFAAPLVTATIALMQSINPNLSPAEIKSLLRQTANPIDANEVLLADGSTDVFVRPLTSDESSNHQGKGAMLSVEGAIQAALGTLEEDTLPVGDRVRVQLASPEEETKVTIEVTIPNREGTAFNRADIMFVVDVTGSYRDDIETFRQRAGDIANASQSIGANVHIGLASFSTIPGRPWGGRNDYPYRLDLPLSLNGEGLRQALDELQIVSYFFGPDQLESQLDALFEAADDVDVEWRQGSLRLAFLATDESFTDRDKLPEYPGRGYLETVKKLMDERIQVWGLTSGGALDDVSRIASDTGGKQIALSRDSSEIVDAINQAVMAEATDLSVRLIPHGDFYRTVRKIKPLDEMDATECNLENTNPLACDPKTGVSPGDRVSFEVTFKGVEGIFNYAGSRQLSFRLQVDANGGAVVMVIPVTVEIQ